MNGTSLPRCLVFFCAPYYVLCPTLVHDRIAFHVLWDIHISENYALTFYSFLKSCRIGVPSGFFHDPQMQLADGQRPSAICGLSRNILSFKTLHRMFRLFEYKNVDRLSVFLAVRQMMAIDWFSSGCFLWFSYCWKTGLVFSSETYVQVKCEHGRLTNQVFPVVSVKICGPLIIVEIARQKLSTFCGEAGPEVGSSPGMLFTSTAGSDAIAIDEMYSKDADDGAWFLYDIVSTFWRAVSVCAREVWASFIIAQEAQSEKNRKRFWTYCISWQRHL